MFSGIVQGKGRILSFRDQEYKKETFNGKRVKILWGSVDGSDVKKGDSISVNGVCLTVIYCDEKAFEVDISEETFSRTCNLKNPGVVNLEKAAKFSDRIGGHFVTGHIDGTAKVISVTPVENSWKIISLIPKIYSKFLTEKGSIAINGVSLTINSLKDTELGCLISINIIPHTWENTTFSELEKGSVINFEIDLIARTLARLMQNFKIDKGSRNEQK